MPKKPAGGVVLEDGPAAGRYSIRRAPHWLRAVVATDGQVDLLDQLDDTPRADERVHVYEAIEPGLTPALPPGVIICPPLPLGATGRYRHLADVDGEQLRETEAWRTWVRAQPAPWELVDPVTHEVHR